MVPSLWTDVTFKALHFPLPHSSIKATLLLQVCLVVVGGVLTLTAVAFQQLPADH